MGSATLNYYYEKEEISNVAMYFNFNLSMQYDTNFDTTGILKQCACFG